MRRYLDTIRTLFSIAGDKKFIALQMLISDILLYAADLLPPIATAGIIAVITENREFNAIWIYVILYIIFYAIYFGMYAWNYWTYTILHHYYYNSVQQMIFNHVAEDEMILNKISKGKIAETCSEDVRYLVDVVDMACDGLTGIIQLVIIFCIFSYYNIFVALIALLIDGFYIWLMSRNSKAVAKHYEGTRKYQDKIIDILNQMLSNLRQVKSLNIMPNLEKKLKSTRRSWTEQSNARLRKLTERYCELPAIIYLGKIILYIFLAYLATDGKISLDKLVLLISYYEIVITNTDTLLEDFLNLSNYTVRVNRIKAILSYTTDSEIDYGDIDNDYINGVVTFDKVNYKLKDRQILNNISFKARPNEITVIVGRPGSGKTTIINLLYRLYRINAGAILIDDESIYNYSERVYSSNVSGVFQKTFAFKMSIRENLALVDGKLENQIEACKRVGIYKDIERLPYGFNTTLDPDHCLLTEGQLQKLAIARALLSKAEILLFDEVTSNVDPASTKDIISIFEDLKTDHTVIIITHKPEIMEIADQVIVLNNGKISAKGTNTDVFEKSALYRELRTATFARPSVNDDFIDTPDSSSENSEK